MEFRRCHFNTQVIDNKIYALGGKQDSNNYLPTVEKYEPSTNTWTTRAFMNKARSLLEAKVIEGKIYAIGGHRYTNADFKNLASAEVFTVEASDINKPVSLTASGRNSNVDLSWSAVTGATSYKVYRALTSGDPYTQIATGVAGTTYTDSDVTNGTTYYYVVTAVSSDGESAYSNEAFATPNKDEPGGDESGKAILNIYMVDGILKEYDLPMTVVNAFIGWYDQRATSTGKGYYIIEKIYNKGPFKSRNDYIIFDKIKDFEVNQYA